MEDLKKQKIELALEEKEVQTKEFFLSFSSRKRHIALALIILIIPIYFIAKYSLAAYFVHDYAKVQIGAHPSAITSLPIKVVEVKALTIVDGNYSAYALLKNQNKDLVASQLDYTFHFVDANNKDLTTPVSGSTYILGGEQKYVLVPNIKLAQAPTGVRVEVPTPQWKKRLSIPNIILKNGIAEFADQTSPDGFYIKNTVSNSSVYSLRTVLVNAVVFDKDHNVIAVTQYTANTMSPNETRTYKMFWPLPIAANVSGVPTIIAESNPFDPDNFK